MSAKMQHESARTKTVWNFTQLLGRRYESLTTDEERMLPFSCRETIGGRVGIEVGERFVPVLRNFIHFRLPT